MTRLSLVLHTHMPYVEGFGTWPFGEEWLWEAIATSYLPLLHVLDEHPGKVTVSLTPVLCDQLEAPGALERCLAFLREIRPASHQLDIDAADAPVAAVLERSAAAYAAAADALSQLESWSTESIEEALRARLVDEMGLKPRVAFGPVRVAVTGRRISPPLFESMELLGRSASLARLNAVA